MKNANEIELTCTEDVLEAAADIAQDYGLAISDVVELITDLEDGELTAEVSSAETARRVDELRGIINEILPGLKRLSWLAFKDIGRHGSLRTLSVTMLALTMISGTGVIRLGNFGRALEAAADWVGDMETRPDEMDARDAIILAKMMTATLFWLEYDDPAPFGKFVETPEGRVPEEGTALEFVTRVILAANEDLDLVDLYASFAIIEANMNLDGSGDDEEEDPKPTVLRLVSSSH